MCEFSISWLSKIDRAKTDMPRLLCEITEVFGDKEKTYMLGTMFGTIKGKFRGGDLQSYDGSVTVVHGDITFSIREASQKFNPCNKFTKSSCKCSSGCKTNQCICRKNGIQCSTNCHNAIQFAQTLKCQHRHQEHHYCHQVIEQYLIKLDG